LVVDGPFELPLVERDVVRAVVIDSSNRVLLLHTRDLKNPAFGVSWELPGGGMESNETYIDTVIRELREETGIRIGADGVGLPTWRRDVSYEYRGARRLHHEIIATVRLRRLGPMIESSHRVDFEAEDHFEYRWWLVDEIISSSERFYPRSLPALLVDFLAGKEIQEPFEFWP
jgi:8-oxo-dGTP pyrophosphatase MutT (NUDIX family)